MCATFATSASHGRAASPYTPTSVLPILTIELVGNDTVVDGGDVVEYTVIVQHSSASPVAAHDLVVTDDLVAKLGLWPALS